MELFKEYPLFSIFHIHALYDLFLIDSYESNCVAAQDWFSYASYYICKQH